MPTIAPAAPEMFLAAAICAVLLVDVFLRDHQRGITYALAMLAIAGAAGFSAWFAVDERLVTFHGSFVADPAGGVLKMFAYATVAVVFLYSREYLVANGLFKGEYFVLGLFGLMTATVLVARRSSECSANTTTTNKNLITPKPDNEPSSAYSAPTPSPPTHRLRQRCTATCPNPFGRCSPRCFALPLRQAVRTGYPYHRPSAGLRLRLRSYPSPLAVAVAVCRCTATTQRASDR
jgi:hypothetical protein